MLIHNQDHFGEEGEPYFLLSDCISAATHLMIPLEMQADIFRVGQMAVISIKYNCTPAL